MMRTDNLDQKVRVFADREVESLVNHADFHFGDLMRLPLETKDGLVLESTFCDGYHDLKYLLAMSVQAGCASKCRFCELGDGGLERDLTTDEILDQLALLLKTAMKRGYHIFDRPLKASFVMGGEPLDNQQFSGVLRKM
ncbi:TPA: hypothetical protein HA265_08445, partial [Candidatus Woesearchaeota archaeon]|nr:hypothetical protein [Candidatus Woesearchaeota archaeon]